MSIKTRNELKQEWVEEELTNLANLDRDTFDLFAAWWTQHGQEDETPYTYKQAKADIGESTDWEDARTVSLRKWKQIAAGDEDSYREAKLCGYCFVAKNHAELVSYSELCPLLIGVAACPAQQICHMILNSTSWDAMQVVRDIAGLEHPRKEKI